MIPHPHCAREVFRVFLRLGLTSFGGPIAHLGYFREEFVVRRRWVDEARYAELLAICQFLPGPASSQMGFAIGLLRAGWRGALAAFTAFTLPSALLMLAFAGFAPRLGDEPGRSLVHGLKLVAVCVVAHGVIGMARQMTPDLRRILIAALGCALVLWLGTAWSQLVAIAAGAALGAWWCRHVPARKDAPIPVPYGRRIAATLLAIFSAGLLLAVLWPSDRPTIAAMASAFYRAGALVFGGGHVVLPLLQQSLVDTGWMSADTFLAGYGAAQAVPGPMFSIASFLGAELPTGVLPFVSALVAVLAIFLPGFLLLGATLPLWQRVSAMRNAAPTLAGVNAAVVGLLAAALYDPVWTQGVAHWSDVVIVAIGLALLLRLRVGALWVVAWCVAAALLAQPLR